MARHTKVMLKMLGVFKKDLSKDEKQQILEIIEDYGNGYAPQVVQLKLFSYYGRKHDQRYLKQ